MGKQKYWVLYVDEFTGFKKSHFLHMKNEQVEVLVDWFDELESKYSISVRCIHCDNAGENRALQQQLKKDGLKHYLSDYCLMMAENWVNPNEQKMFVEAWHHPNPVQWENWEKAIRKEFSSTIK